MCMGRPCAEAEPVTPVVPGLVCPLCGSPDTARCHEGSDRKFRGPGRFAYLRCLRCGLVFLHPRPPMSELWRHYPDHVTHLRIGAGASVYERTRRAVKRTVAEECYGYAPILVPARRLARPVLKGLAFSPKTLRLSLERAGFVATRIFYQYHPHDRSRSLLYALEARGAHRARRWVARWIRPIECGVTVCSPFRRLFGRGGVIHLEARKALPTE